MSSKPRTNSKTNQPLEGLDAIIQSLENKSNVSDGYHTFGELYEHRNVLFIALCRSLAKEIGEVWRSRRHSDGSGYDGYFVLGIYYKNGKQITYHLPEKHWEDTIFARTRRTAPKFDKHTSKDVLMRLTNIK